jgi:hypothetical protein
LICLDPNKHFSSPFREEAEFLLKKAAERENICFGNTKAANFVVI